MRFDPCVKMLGAFPAFSQSETRREISQPRVPIAEARNGGPAHRAFIDALPEHWRTDPDVEIFSRMVWLKKGWYPLSPHYHLDWYTGPLGPRVETIMVLLGDVSRTEFVTGSVELEAGLTSGSPMHLWGKQIEDGVRAGRWPTWSLEPERMILFDNRTWHRARPAVDSGFRLLLRAIRGLPKGDGPGQYGNRGPFAAIRNEFVPETDEEARRYEPYRR